MSINLVTNQQIDILSGTLNKLKRKDVEIWQIKMSNFLLNQPNFRWHSFISNELKQVFEMHVHRIGSYLCMERHISRHVYNKSKQF